VTETRQPPAGPASAGAPTERSASHVAANRLTTARALLREHAGHVGAAQWIGQVTNGLWEISVDWFADPERCPTVPDVEDLRTDVQQFAREFSMTAVDLERRLEGARTGRLLRVVVETATAAGSCFALGLGVQHLVGVRFGLEELDRSDAVVAVLRAEDVMVELVRAKRASRGLPDLYPGGDTADTELEPMPDPAHQVQAGSLPGIHDGLQDALRAVVDHRTVNWAALRLEGTPARWWSIDAFDHPQMVERFADDTSPTAHRDFYEKLLEDVHAVLSQTNLVVEPVLGHPVQRLILDVEEGAVVVHRLAPRQYLVGVGLDQMRVRALELALQALVDQHAVR
jgi:hypothetical protein